MGVFGDLFKKKLKIESQDPVFGKITFEDGFWFADWQKRENHEFVVSIDAPETGPTDTQRKFFKHICSELPKLESQGRESMRSNVEDSIDVSKLTIYSVEIDSEENLGKGSFVLEFSDEQANEIHRVSFGPDKVQYLGYDC